MLQDLRYGFRVLSSRPGFTLVAALSLALGIGANSAIFSLIDTLWLRPLAVTHSSEIVRVFSTTDQQVRGALSYPEFLDLQKQSSTLSGVVAIGGRGAGLIEGDSRLLVTLNLVSSNFFSALGIQPELGRLFAPEDETGQTNASIEVVLGHGFWQRHFGGDRSIVGKQIRIQRVNDVLVTVIGVLPRNFRDIETGDDRDLWFSSQSWSTLGSTVELQSRGNRWFRVLGRLAPHTNIRAANAELQTIAGQMAMSYPETNRGRNAAVIGDLDYRMQQAGQNGIALLAIVLLVVLLSSVNVANLLLSRTSSRGREMAVRVALGANRSRLIRQLMAENLLLNLAGLALGLLIGAWLIAMLPVLMVQPPGLNIALDFALDSRVLLFSAGVSLMTLILFGVLPTWKATRTNVVPALKGENTFVDSGRHRWPVRNFLVVGQVAISVMLLVSAAVLAKSFSNTRTQDLGFGRKQLLLVWVSNQAATPSLYRDVIANFEGMPGVRSVSAAVRAPLSLSSNGMFRRVSFPDRPQLAQSPPFEIKYNSVTANFFQAMGTPILRGRGFDTADEAGNLRSVLINERMAERFWPGEEAVGKSIRLGPSDYSVIGVVRNAPINAVGEPPEPYLYLPYWANFEQEATFIIETTGEASALAQSARSILKRVDARLDPLGITTENELIRYSAQTYQITAELVGGLGLLGLILTAVGLYGVVSYNANLRTRELGVRMALGASRSDTLWLVLREVLIMGAVGVAVGLPLAMAATRLLTSLLFGVSPWDIPAFTVAIALLAVVIILAAWIPARRATRVPPSAALRVM